MDNAITASRPFTIRNDWCDFLFYDKQVLRQSRLYESAPAYVTDQPRFVNGALAAMTSLQPLELLDALKFIEVNAAADWGPPPWQSDAPKWPVLLIVKPASTQVCVWLPNAGAAA